MLIDLLIATSCAVAGLLCGWLAYPAITKIDATERSHPVTQSDDLQPCDAEEAIGREEQARLVEIANRLSLLTGSVAASVHQHRSELQVANELVLQAGSKHDSATLLQVMNRLLDASEMMRDQLRTAERKLVEQNQLLQTAQQRSLVDALTQVANRRGLDAHLESRVALAGIKPSTLMMIDIDHFKHFNDTYGHLAGDAVLRNVAALLQDNAPGDGFLARYGGEEFVVVFDAPMRDCIARAENLRGRIEVETFSFEGQEFQVTASMGIAELNRDTNGEFSAETWLHQADTALYASKALRNCGHAMLDGTPARIHDELPSESSPLQNEPTATHKVAATPKPPSTNTDDLPHGLKGLPTGQKLLDQFTELATGVNVVGFAFVTAVVRINNSSPSGDDLQTISRTIRSVVRSIDHIGLLDRKTLVVAMPNIDHETALQKADRIRSSLVFSSGAHFDSNAEPLTTSVALCSNCEKTTFPEMLRTSLRLLDKHNTGQNSQTLAAWC